MAKLNPLQHLGCRIAMVGTGPPAGDLQKQNAGTHHAKAAGDFFKQNAGTHPRTAADKKVQGPSSAVVNGGQASPPEDDGKASPPEDSKMVARPVLPDRLLRHPVLGRVQFFLLAARVLHSTKAASQSLL